MVLQSPDLSWISALTLVDCVNLVRKLNLPMPQSPPSNKSNNNA